MSDNVARCVFVISDLHIGGTYGKTSRGRGFRINTRVSELAQFIRTIAQNGPGDPKVELIINGDIIDFLAEREDAPPYWNPFTSDVEAACQKLQNIADRDRPFFDALHELLERGHRLTMLLGNHDIELALPPVRQKLKELIGVAGHHDYEFIFNGEAYIVGDALIEHGNRYDSFNMVDHDSLRRISSLLSRRQPIPKKYAFTPLAGSKMVSWVINEIKEDYKFIDLLQPWNDIALPFLLALEPGYRQLLATVAKLGLQARRHRLEEPALPSYGGDIHADGDSAPAVFVSDLSTYSEEAPVSQPINEEEAALTEILKERLGNDVNQFLDTVSPEGAGQSPQIGGDIAAANFIDRKLGMAKLFLSRDDQDVGRRLPALLMSLRALQPDRSFDLDFETAEEYTNAAADLLNGGFHYVLFGHTHLAKKIELRPGCWYLNSGTWADLMRLPPEIITGSEDVAMSKVRQLMIAIATKDLSGWVIFRPTYIRLDLDASDHIVQAEVYEYTDEASVRERTPFKRAAGV